MLENDRTQLLGQQMTEIDAERATAVKKKKVHKLNPIFHVLTLTIQHLCIIFQKVFVHILDLSEARKIWDFSERFRKDHETLNVLINNAGCMINQRGCTAEGMEMNFATNTLSTYILTTSLIPLLEKSEDPRVCQQVVMTEQWSQTHKTIHFSVMHTGWVDTPGVRSAMSNFYSSVQDKLRTPEQGADTVVWLAVSGAAVKQPSGLFFQDRKTVSTHLPLAWTRSSSEEQTFMKKLEKLANSFKPQ
nr:PREDICTED: dehydrogenase/reductase SDR family member 12-like [Latimeria chalumnae]|eukprot:XP_014353947.1 PREDICTED: dehydrogenase/reductase SDR family member 12-like [Latimeria chalumnae]